MSSRSWIMAMVCMRASQRGQVRIYLGKSIKRQFSALCEGAITQFFQGIRGSGVQGEWDLARRAPRLLACREVGWWVRYAARRYEAL